MSSGETVKIAILGLPGVGKTALTVKVVSGRFIWNYHPTLENIYKYSLVNKAEAEETSINLEIMDTAGYIAFETNSPQQEGYVKWANGLILMYSIVDLSSFEAIKSLIMAIIANKTFNNNIALVANKSDMDHLRQVKTEAGQKLADEFGCRFYEISVMTEFERTTQPFIDLCADAKHSRDANGAKLRRRSSASQRLKKLIQKKLSI
ncbi:ras-related and estrogen-regulated growth inhibitor-like [Watersipora subatra]|uniref:ras-related and estrogen-regulated growth inhibitor-like n=1 Tax=Watersipora subatra TaxID=2589382 RepID=UPI00355C2203